MTTEWVGQRVSDSESNIWLQLNTLTGEWVRQRVSHIVNELEIRWVGESDSESDLDLRNSRLDSEFRRWLSMGLMESKCEWVREWLSYRVTGSKSICLRK